MVYKLISKDGDGLIEVRQGRGLGVHLRSLEGPANFKYIIAAHRLFESKKKSIVYPDFTLEEILSPSEEAGS